MPQATLPQGTVHYRDTGAGEPVVFLHGYLMDSRLWDPVADRLTPRLRCIRPDLPLGAHRIPLDPEADLSLPGIARLVADFLAALDLRGVTLVGNDSGAGIAQIVAANHPERIGRLVLTDGDCFDNCPPKWFKQFPLAARVPGLLALALQSQRVRAARRLPFAYGLLTRRALPDDLIGDWVDAFHSDAGVRHDCVKVTRGLGPAALLDATAKLGSFDKPVLLAWAPEDRLFPFEHAERLAAILPDARVETVPDSLTWVMRDQPERIAALIEEFIASTPLRPAAQADTPRA